jgi:hypothetical protein
LVWSLQQVPLGGFKINLQRQRQSLLLLAPPPIALLSLPPLLLGHLLLVLRQVRERLKDHLL